MASASDARSASATPVFRLFAAEMHFDQHREALFFCGCGGIEFFCEREAIERIHAMEKLRDARGFIGLHVADHVTVGVEAGELREFRLPFLHAIFAEVAHACIVRSAYGRRRKCFRDGDDFDFRGCAAEIARRRSAIRSRTFSMFAAIADCIRIHARDSSMVTIATSSRTPFAGTILGSNGNANCAVLVRS